MTEELVKELIEKIKEKAYVPSDWRGVTERKVVRLNDVINILNEYKVEYKKYYW